MDIEFHWIRVPQPDAGEIVEREISAILIDRRIQACHPGPISVSVQICGPLETSLEGAARCQCGKSIMTFRGDSRASKVVFTECR